MLESPIISIILTVFFILIAAFLGSWLALTLSARRKAVSSPDLAAEEEPAPATPAKSAREYSFKHAFDFNDDTCTMILELPVAMLEDDLALADAWVDVVGWARMAWQDVQAGENPTESPPPPEETNLDESEITRDHLEGALQRLHESAERRRELRAKLAEQQHGSDKISTTA